MQQHAALAQRVVAYTQLTAKTDPALVNAMLDHGLAAAEAREMLIRATHEPELGRVLADVVPQLGLAGEVVTLAPYGAAVAAEDAVLRAQRAGQEVSRQRLAAARAAVGLRDVAPRVHRV